MALLCVCLSGGDGQAWAFASSGYFPLQTGNTWTYQKNGVPGYSETVQPATTNINGVDTKGFQDSDGIVDFFTNDSNGIRQHRSADPSVSTTITYSPPIQSADAEASVGQTVNSSGTATVDVAGVGTFVLSYTSSSTVEAFETITVPAGTFDTVRLQTSLIISGTILGQDFNDTETQTLWLGNNIGVIKSVNVDADGTDTLLLTGTNVIPPGPGVSLVSSVLPISRSVQVGTLATAFAAIINTGSQVGTSCQIAPLDSVPATFVYQTTDPATNQVTGTSNTPVIIHGNNGLQTFVIGFTPTAPFDPTDVRLTFSCTNSGPAPITSGLNTLLLSASAGPVPDLVAVTALPPPPAGQPPNTVTIPGAAGTTLFGAAAVNVGADGLITASADTGAANLPVILGICLTFPSGTQQGQCQAPFAPTVTTTLNTGDTPSFAIVVTGTGIVPFNPAINRINVRFRDAGNVIRGATNVAVQTQTP
jgi:hypothetical protein